MAADCRKHQQRVQARLLCRNPAAAADMSTTSRGALSTVVVDELDKSQMRYLKHKGKSATRSKLIKELRALNVTTKELVAEGYSLAALKAGGYSVKECRAAGFSLEELKEGGVTKRLKESGHMLSELKKAGCRWRQAQPTILGPHSWLTLTRLSASSCQSRPCRHAQRLQGGRLLRKGAALRRRRRR